MLPKVTHYQTQISEDLATYQTRTNIFKYSFFPYSIMEWNKLTSSTQNSTDPLFRNHLLKLIWSEHIPVYNIQNYIDLKLLTRLMLGLSHLNEHRFNHNFQNCHHNHDIRAKLLSRLEVIDTNLLKVREEELTKVLL